MVNSLKSLMNWAIKTLQEAHFVLNISSAFVEAH